MRSGLTAFAACCGAAWLSAAEPAPARNARDDDPIGAAKRELEKTSAERSGGQPAPGGLPKFDLPELQQPGNGAMSAAPGAQKKKRASAADRKSANWLVEAMEKKSDPRDAHAHADERRADEFSPATDEAGATERARIESAGEAHSRESASGAGGEKTNEGRGPRRAEPVPNPLARYMSDWMTPRDYALLKPVVDASARGSESGMAGGGISMPIGTSLAVATGETEIAAESHATARGAIFSPPTAQENPYLQSLATPSPAVPQPTVIPSASAVPAPVVAPPTPAPEPAKNKMPDFAKPLDDQKYFKPLKRF